MRNILADPRSRKPVVNDMCALMLAEEMAIGREPIYPDNAPRWLDPDDWHGWPVLSLGGGELHIIAIWSARRRAFTDLLNVAQSDGLTPVVVAPLAVMTSILERWGWARSIVGEGIDVREEWRPA